MADRGVSLSLASVPRAVRQRYEQRSDRLTRTRSVRDALLSLAGLIGKPVLNQAGEQIGRIVDLVARWDSNQAYPPVTGLIVRVGRRRAWLPFEAVDHVGRDPVRLRTARLDLRDVAAGRGRWSWRRCHRSPACRYRRRAGYPRLGPVPDTGCRGGAAGRRGHRVQQPAAAARPGAVPVPADPEKVIDWADRAGFGSQRGSGPCSCGAAGRCSGCARASWLTCWRTWAGPSAASCWQLVSPETAADALEEMQAEELVQLLRESDTGRGARAAGPDGAGRGRRRAARPATRRAGRSCSPRCPPAGRDRVATLLGYGERHRWRDHDHRPGPRDPGARRSRRSGTGCGRTGSMIEDLDADRGRRR